MQSLRQTLQEKREILRETVPYRIVGNLKQVAGVIAKASLQSAKIGEICMIKTQDNQIIRSEVVGFHEETTLLMPYGYVDNLHPRAQVIPTGETLKINCGQHLLGTVLDAMGDQILHSPFNETRSMNHLYSVINSPPSPLERKKIDQPFLTGIPALDLLFTMGKGQRMGIFAAAGTGKSTLIGQIASKSTADVVVLNLVGERGREVREFIEDQLTEEVRQRTVVVVATSDQPAILRLKSAHTATTVAEYFRDQGKNVLLIMDSVTRFARALREIGLARGEAPARQGYPPSVFAELPRLLERSGNSKNGSITAIYTVLVDGDDITEPVADEVMSILDGHLILSRKLAAKNLYPAIDPLLSKSRVMNRVITETHRDCAQWLINNYSEYDSNEEAIKYGFHKKGQNEMLDLAVSLVPIIDIFLHDSELSYSSMESLISQFSRFLKGHNYEVSF